MFAKKIQRVRLELVLDSVGEESVEAGKVIHVSVRHKGVADAQELPRRQRSHITEIE